MSNKELFQRGISLGMCKKFQSLWREDITFDELCEMYHRGLDFCIDKGYPDKETIASLNKETMARHGIYFDCDGIEIENQHNIVIGGKSKATIKVSTISDITLIGDAEVDIILEKDAFAYVSMWHNSKVVSVKRLGRNKLCASLFGGTIECEDKFDKIYYKNTKR